GYTVSHDGAFRQPRTPGPGASLQQRAPHPAGSSTLWRRAGTGPARHPAPHLDHRAPRSGALYAWRRPAGARPAGSVRGLFLGPGTRLARVLDGRTGPGGAAARGEALARPAAAATEGLR